MIKDDWNGISEIGIDKLMIDIIDYAEKTNQIFNNITELVAKTKIFFDCESGENFRKRYEDLQPSFSTINNNILSYNTDLLSVKTDYKKRELFSVETLSKVSNSVDSKL